MITVTTPNGRVGQHVLRMLLERGETVRVISYNPDKLPQAVRDNCEVVAGSLDDVETLKRGFAGAESVFFCIPQTSKGNTWEDAHEYHDRFARAAADALRGSDTRLVFASAGRHGYEDNGIVSAFAAAEDTLNAAGVPARHLRASFFMENLMQALPTLKVPGAVFQAAPSDVPLPMVCTPDVALKAVEYLTDRSWRDQQGVGVHGPAHVSFNEMAGILTEVLGKPINYVEVPPQVVIENLKRAGTTDGFAQAYSRLLTKDALKAYDIEPRTPATTTPTTLREWATSNLLPAFN